MQTISRLSHALIVTVGISQSPVFFNYVQIFSYYENGCKELDDLLLLEWIGVRHLCTSGYHDLSASGQRQLDRSTRLLLASAGKRLAYRKHESESQWDYEPNQDHPVDARSHSNQKSPAELRIP